jgi:hypothetical protein
MPRSYLVGSSAHPPGSRDGCLTIASDPDFVWGTRLASQVGGREIGAARQERNVAEGHEQIRNPK